MILYSTESAIRAERRIIVWYTVRCRIEAVERNEGEMSALTSASHDSCSTSYSHHVYLGRSQHGSTRRASRSSTHTHSQVSFTPAVLLPYLNLWRVSCVFRFVPFVDACGPVPRRRLRQMEQPLGQERPWSSPASCWIIYLVFLVIKWRDVPDAT